MKKNFKKVLALLCAGAACFNLVACGGGGGDGEEEIDETKTQLYISNFNGGVGTEWLEKHAARFEEEYKNVEFTPGKFGVQVIIETHKGVSVDKFATERNEIYFLENCNYYDMLSTGHLLDITDVVQKDMAQFGEAGSSIESKMAAAGQAYVDYFKTSQGKYYAIPHYRSIYGITYDKGLFDEKGFYLFANGEVGATYADVEAGRAAKGPDGKAGTYDDGLPATYDDLWKVCRVMVESSVDPFTWSGQYKWYASCFMASLKADFEGEEASMAYGFDSSKFHLDDEDTSNDGKVTKLVKEIKADGTVVYDEPTALTYQNGNEVYRSAGVYYANEFIYQIVKNNWYSSRSFNESVSHIDTQANYLLSKYGNDKQIAMLVEGSWWSHEASSYVQQMENRYKETFAERGFALMPLPKATKAQVGETQTTLDASGSLACINANIDTNKIELAKTFLQFCETDKSLVEFLQTTGMTRGYGFNLADAEYKALTPFAQSVVDIIKNGEVTLPVSSSEFFYKNYSDLLYSACMKTPTNEYPSVAFKDKNYTAKQMFEEIKAHRNSKWSSYVAKMG